LNHPPCKAAICPFALSEPIGPGHERFALRLRHLLAALLASFASSAFNLVQTLARQHRVERPLLLADCRSTAAWSAPLALTIAGDLLD